MYIPAFKVQRLTDSSMSSWEATKFWPSDAVNMGKYIAGTYLFREHYPGDSRTFYRLVTLMADGTWVSNHSHQQTKEFGFSSEQGVWEIIGRRKIAAKAMDFDLDSFDGSPTGMSKIAFMMEMSDDFREVQGDLFGGRYHLDQNPLNSFETPHRTFGGTFTGRRVLVDAWK